MAATFPSAYLFKAVDPKTTAEKRRRGRCICFGCRRRAEKKQRKLRCATCNSRLFRFAHDDRYAYNNLKYSAKLRHIEFHLSFEDFMEFCAITGYLELRGKEPHSFSIDRIKTDRPYEMGNIRILTYADNISHHYEEHADQCRRRRTSRNPRAA